MYLGSGNRTSGSSLFSEKNGCEFFPPEKISLLRCPGCNRFVVKADGEIVYPTGVICAPAAYMPESVKRPYVEAQSVVFASPRAACAMLRVCLERLVTEAGGTGNRLVDKAESLCLTPRLKKLCDTCRLAGNEAVHSELFDFSMSQSEAKDLACNLMVFIDRLTEEFFGFDAAVEKFAAQTRRGKR